MDGSLGKVVPHLAGERAVAVDEDGHGAAAGGVVLVELARAALTQHHRVDRLEVRRVGEQREVDRLARLCRPVERRAQVVLDVAGACITEQLFRVCTFVYIIARACAA